MCGHNTELFNIEADSTYTINDVVKSQDLAKPLHGTVYIVELHLCSAREGVVNLPGAGRGKQLEDCLS